ncbi:PREDICTED: uncharacterized protein LOC108373323 [Rhagoletis zephyria]|uniref:uncharacterized protein LOC108373323 n=1 Tax=Rhagoletis zephyria TaxID=28612 RepID=UPI00081157DA|nr:PREDICTED: uncharacterized protein LOC108373323 [Rhagoletis zephyria]
MTTDTTTTAAANAAEMEVLTENEALTYSSSADARLDFLFHVIEGSSPERTTELLKASWAQAPLDTLKLVFNARDIRRGKGIRGQFLICAQWLIANQLETLLANLPLLTEPFGCWKDLLNVLMVALFSEAKLLPHDAFTEEGRKEPLVSPYDRHILRASANKEQRKALAATKTTIRQIRRRLIVHGEEEVSEEAAEEGDDEVAEGGDEGDNEAEAVEAPAREKRSRMSRQIDIVKAPIGGGEDAAEGEGEGSEDHAQPQRLEFKKRASYFPAKARAGDKAVYRVKTDRLKVKQLGRYRYQFFTAAYQKIGSPFRRLYDRVVELYAQQLLADYENLQAGQPTSLAAKWLPSPGRHFDKYLYIHVAIGRRFLELKSVDQPLAGVSLTSHRQVESAFRKVYAALRAAMHLPEVAMSARAWADVRYYNVPSVAMLRYKAVYSRADFDRFAAYVADRPVKGGALTPGEIVAETVKLGLVNGTLYGALKTEMAKETELQLDVLDGQWKSLVTDIMGKGHLLIKDALAICDVSGSMLDSSQKVAPMYGAIGLTLMLLQLSAGGRWARKVIAFSESPSIAEIDIESASLRQQIKRMMSIPFGYSTNLNKAFTLLLDEAKRMELTGEEMPKVLFIFTDMEFNSALPEKTNFEAAQEQFREAGFPMPLVVFWNLKGDKASRSTPVQCHEEGVFLLSGYSAQTINFFFTASDVKEMTPLSMLQKIIGDERYSGVKVVPTGFEVEVVSPSSLQPMAVDDEVVAEEVAPVAEHSPMRE